MDNYEYKNMLNLLKEDEDTFIGFIKLVKPKTLDQMGIVVETARDFENIQEIKNIISPVVNDRINKILKPRSRGGFHGALGRELPRIVNKLRDILDDKIKSKLIEKACTKMSEFYPYAKKDMLKAIVPWVSDERSAVKIIQNHHGMLDIGSLDSLLSILPNRENHSEISKFIKKSRSFVAMTLQNLDLNNADDRHKFINSIAQRTSIIKSVDVSNLKITLDDLKKLPPARRFDFLNYLYEPLMGRKFKNNGEYYGNFKFLHKDAFRKNEHGTRLPVENIEKEDIKNLLFSVSLSKNECVRIWWNRFDSLPKYMFKPPVKSNKKRTRK